MSIPENTLSSEVIAGAFSGVRSLSYRPDEDYEDGGIDIQDPSKGLTFQPWRGWIEADEDTMESKVYLESQNTCPRLVYTGYNITEISFTFDRNMNIALAFVEDGEAKFYWYDTVTASMITTSLGSGVITPRVTHDDKRDFNSSGSDVILAYMRDGALYFKQQRDRYTIEYDPTVDVPEPQRTKYRAAIADTVGLVKIGMNSKLRLQFMFRKRLPKFRPHLPPPCAE